MGHLADIKPSVTEIGIRCRPNKGNLIEAQIVDDQDLRRMAYRIRYEAYHACGFVSDRDDGVFSDEYDTRPNCRTVLILRNGVPAGTIRVAAYDPGHADPAYHRVQAMEIFEPTIRSTVEAARRPGTPGVAVEIGKLARSAAATNDMEVLFALFRAAGYLIMHLRADVVFNAVRSHHMPMYRRFGFRQLEAPRQYPSLSFKTGLMACFRDQYQEAVQKLAFLQGISMRDEQYAALIGGGRVWLPPSGGTRSVAEAMPAMEGTAAASPRVMN